MLKLYLHIATVTLLDIWVTVVIQVLVLYCFVDM
jgi:hypothetical protein